MLPDDPIRLQSLDCSVIPFEPTSQMQLVRHSKVEPATVQYRFRGQDIIFGCHNEQRWRLVTGTSVLTPFRALTDVFSDASCGPIPGLTKDASVTCALSNMKSTVCRAVCLKQDGSPYSLVKALFEMVSSYSESLAPF
eukprot:m.180177 g.180177  ORF g.180177 m.180177 type:complete len:138 (-) comp14653_c0_seq6:79-492(-)